MTGNTFTNIHRMTAVVGIVAALPLVFFVTNNILIYELGILPNWQFPITRPAILLGGCLITLVLNAWSLFDVAISRAGHRVRIVVEFTAHRWNLVTFAVASVFLLATVLYLIVENIGHSAGA